VGTFSTTSSIIASLKNEKKKKSSEKTKKKVQIPKVAFESTAKDGEEITTKQKRKKI